MDEITFYLEDLKSRFNGIDKSKYYLSYSGGKDSHFLYWFIKEYLHDTEIEIVSVNTYMEHHEILERIKKNADVILYPTMKPFEIKEKYGSPCFSKSQDYFIEHVQNGGTAPSILKRFYGVEKSWYNVSKKAREYVMSGEAHKISPKCCKFLKKDPFRLYEKKTGKKAILGVRGNESQMRKSNYKKCFTKDRKFTPLWDLDEDLFNAIHERYGIEVPEVYKHVDRTGCMGCPYGSWKGDCEKELSLISPNQRKFVCELFKESYEVLGVKW